MPPIPTPSPPHRLIYFYVTHRFQPQTWDSSSRPYLNDPLTLTPGLVPFVDTLSPLTVLTQSTRVLI